MPTYEYTCLACDIESEVICKMAERQNQQCSTCGGSLTQEVRTPAQPHWSSLAMGDSASPEAINKFDRMHRQKADQETAKIAEHGSIN